MVIKWHKAEASLLPSGALLHNVNAFNLSIFLKILPDVVLLRVLLDTTNKDLLHCQMGPWFIGVLKQKEAMRFDKHSTHTTELSALGVYLFVCTSLDTALLGSTTLPSTLWGLAFIASSTSITEEYVTKPKPLDRLLLGSLITCKQQHNTKC